jgi:hypothetical protein
MAEQGYRTVIVAVALVFVTGLLLLSSSTDAAAKKTAAKSTGTGHVRWEIKTSIPASANLAQAKVIDVPTMLSIKPPPGAKGHSRAMDHDRYPAAPNANGLVEGDIISGGWIHLIAAEKDDQDYHIQMAETADSQMRCLIVEVPRPTAAVVKDQRVRQAAEEVRRGLRDNALGGKTLQLGDVNLLSSPVFATVTGQFFYDDWHIGGSPRGKKGCKSSTIVEVHPIMTIEFPPGH